MGMLVTSFLIVSGIYASIEAPPYRGLSFVELWYIGIQTPILIAMLEYGTILAIIKYGLYGGIEGKIKLGDKTVKLGNLLNKVDAVVFFLMSTYISIFYFYYISKCSAEIQNIYSK